LYDEEVNWDASKGIYVSSFQSIKLETSAVIGDEWKKPLDFRKSFSNHLGLRETP